MSGQGNGERDNAMTERAESCDHWTYFTLSRGSDAHAVCDLPAAHDGMHKFWYTPAEAYSWAEDAERHYRTGILR